MTLRRARHSRTLVHSAVFTALAGIAPLWGGQSFVRAAADSNVNQRYLVANVMLSGVAVARLDDKALPFPLRSKLIALIGRQCDPISLEELSAEIRSQLHLFDVGRHLSRGSTPDTVDVNFETSEREKSFDLSLPRFLYHSQQHLSGELDATARYRGTSVMVGFISNGDDLTERFTGINARAQSPAWANRRLRFLAGFEDYRERWVDQTLAAAGPANPEIYRSRWNVSPSLNFAATPSVTFSAGMSFTQMARSMPGSPNRAANAGTFGAAFSRKLVGNRMEHQIEGHYDVRVVSRVLGSTYAYARHMVAAKYDIKAGRHHVTESFTGGSIAGNAPMFDRFVLGTSSNLRGWNRYQLDPLGGSRVVHNELSYTFHVGHKSVETFYDTGALWQMEKPAKLRHSTGVSYRQGVFVVTMAFPLRAGCVEPVFMAGMNY